MKVIPLTTVLAIIEAQHGLIKNNNAPYTTQAFTTLYQMFENIEPIEMTTCEDCPYFQARTKMTKMKGIIYEQR